MFIVRLVGGNAADFYLAVHSPSKLDQSVTTADDELAFMQENLQGHQGGSANET